MLLEPDTRLEPLLPASSATRRAIVAPVAERAGRLLRQRGDRVRRDLLRSGGAPGRRSPRAPPTLETGIALLPRQRPFLRDVHGPRARAAPGRHGPARDAAGAQRGDRGRHAGAARLAADQPRPARRAARAQPARHASRRPRSTLQRLGETFDTARAAGRVRRPGADRLQLLELLVHVPARARSPTATRSATSLRQMLTELPARRADGRGARRPATRACRRNGNARRRPPAATFEPYEIPIINAHPYGPTGQHERRLPGRPVRLRARRSCRVPGQRADNPAYRRLRPARLARADDAVLQRRRRARARRHAASTRASPRPGRRSADEGARGQAQRLPSWLIGLVLRRRDRDRLAARLHQGAAVGRRATRSRRSSPRRRACARARRCGSPASTSAR